jgi:thiol:disulfide interchange protein DsbC
MLKETIMKYIYPAVLSFLVVLINTAVAENRWFNNAQISNGETIFQQNCASCHGANANGSPDWPQARGEKAAPPLNGSANSRNKSIEQLMQVIRQGSIQIGGSMPAFKNALSEPEIIQVIAYFQSKWPDEVYQKWAGQHPVADKHIASSSEIESITQLLRMRLGTNDITPPVETEIKGIYQTKFGDKYAYLLDGGRYIFVGDLIDLKEASNLTEVARRGDVKEKLGSIPLTDLVVFPATGRERTVLSVFTDTSCGYCQKLHTEIGHLQEAGISVHYIPFPRGGNRGPGYKDLKSVWCAKDGTKAMDIAKGVDQGALPDGDCKRADMVDKGFALGREMGINGTPALFSANGTKFNGYVPHAELIPMLLNEL